MVARGEGRYHSMPTTPSNSLSTYERDSRPFSEKDPEFSFQAQDGYSAYMRDRDGGVLSGVGDVRTCSTSWPLAVQVSDVCKSVEHTQGQGQGQSIAMHTGAHKGTGEGRRIGIVDEGGEGDTTSGFSSSPGITTDSDVSSERQIGSGDGSNEDREEDGDRGGGGGGEGEGERRGTEEGDEEVETISTVTKNGNDRGLVATDSLLTAKQSENLSSSSKGANKKSKQQKKKTQKK